MLLKHKPHKTIIIAEIGVNHNGKLETAKKLIKVAKNIGADYAKFQTWSVDRLKKGPWDKDGRLEIYKKAELSLDQHFDLASGTQHICFGQDV